jgi:hypothetical protein
MRRLSQVLCAAGFLLLLISLPDWVESKHWGGCWYWNDMGSATISQGIVDRINRKLLLKKINSKRAAKGLPPMDEHGNVVGEKPDGKVQPRAPEKTAEPLPVTFKPSGMSILPAQYARKIGKTPEEQAEMKAYFEEILKAYETDAREQGRLHELGCAAAYFIGTNYFVVTGENPGEAAFDELVTDMRTLMAQNPKIQGMNDRERQEYYEVMVVTGGWAVHGYTQGTEDEKPTYLQMARESLETFFGVPAERVRWTAEGLLITEQ